MQSGSSLKDFGEHIPGARKELAAAAAAEQGGRAWTLAGSWPKPDWAALAARDLAAGGDGRAVALARAIRDAARAHRARRGGERSVAPVLADIGKRVLAGEQSETEGLWAVKLCDAEAARRCTTQAALYAALGHGEDLSAYMATRTGLRKPYGWRIWRRGGGAVAEGETLEAAAAALREKLREGPTTRRNHYELRLAERGGEREYGIWRRAAGGLVEVRSCASLAEARATIRNERAALDAWWTEWLRVPQVRHPTNAPRTPAGAGASDDPDTFTELYGFRGVQFGNWVGNARRHTDLRDAAQALADLALALGWPPDALSLGGRLALAFRARGKGGAQGVKAHYEPDARVIAIAKPAGAGSLAHEWFHALDHHAGAAAGGEYSTRMHRAGTREDGTSRGALEGIGGLLEPSGLKARSARLDRRRARARRYWSSPEEMAARLFEAWVRARLARASIRNDYLVNFVEPHAWKGRPELDQPYLYPYEDELAALTPTVDAVAAAGPPPTP